MPPRRNARAQGSEKRQGQSPDRCTEGGSQGRQEGQTVPARATSIPSAESKGAKILELINWPKGATLTEIMKNSRQQPVAWMHRSANCDNLEDQR
jgi:hypothetical protein